MTLSNKEQAKRAFDTLKVCLEDSEWKYSADEEKLVIETDGVGDDLQIEIHLHVSEDRLDVSLLSPMPFGIVPDGRFDTMLAITMINDSISTGSFDYNIETRDIWYRQSMSFSDMDVAKSAYAYFLGYGVEIVDSFNDKLLMISKGMYTIDQLGEYLSAD